MDADGRKRKKSWSFTVGEEDAPAQDIPEGSVAVGNVSVPLSFFHPGSKVKGSVLVKIYEDGRGNRRIEYVFAKEDSTQAVLSTTSLKGFRKITSNDNDPGKVFILPQSPYSVEGSKFNFSYHYEGDAIPVRNTWQIRSHVSGSSLVNSSEPVVPWVFKTGVSATLKLLVKIPAEDESSQDYYYNLTKYRTLNSFTVSDSFRKSHDFIITQTGSGTISVSTNNRVKDQYKYYKLIEGASYTIFSRGKLFIKKSRWKIINGAQIASFEDPKANPANLVFNGTGFAEVVHEFQLEFTWAGEEHKGEPNPTTRSGLFGLFSYDAKAVFENIPSGIIYGTKRDLAPKELELTLNGEKRILNSGNSNIEPPIILGESILFPKMGPLKAALWDAALLVKTKGMQRLLGGKDYSKLFYNDNYLPEKKRFPYQLYFHPKQTKWDKSKRKPKKSDGSKLSWAKFNTYYKPVSDWKYISAYEKMGELIDVNIKTKIKKDRMYVGQKLDCEVEMLPKPGLGTGKYSLDEQTLTILDDYKITDIHHIAWHSTLEGEVNSKREGSDWLNIFDPKLGTGTYKIEASVNASVKLQEDEEIAPKEFVVTGTISKMVSEGLEITSPGKGLEFPRGTIVEIHTSFDDDLEEWKKIKWTKRNNPAWKPKESKPPIRVKIESDETTITAVYPVAGADDFKDSISLKASNILFLNSEDAVATTSRIIPLCIQYKDGNGNRKPLPPKWFEWQTNVVATVTHVLWKDYYKDGVLGKIENQNSVNALANFSNGRGAMTAIASVTIQLHKKVNGKTDAKPMAKFDVILQRADLWSYKAPKWAATAPTGNLPKKAIVDVGRTFYINKGGFKFRNKTINLSSENGELDTVIQLESALNTKKRKLRKLKKRRTVFFLKGLKCDWYFNNKTNSDLLGKNRILIKPEKKDEHSIEILSYLDFGKAGKIYFEPKALPGIEAVNLNTLLRAKVNPENFFINPGTPKILEMSPMNNKDEMGSSVEILDGAYEVKFEEVEWFLGESPKPIYKGNPFSFVFNEHGLSTSDPQTSLRLNAKNKKVALKEVDAVDGNSETTSGEYLSGTNGYLIPDSIEVRLNGIPKDSVEVSYKKAKTIFEAYGVYSDFKKQIPVGWRLTPKIEIKPGSMRQKILTELDTKLPTMIGNLMGQKEIAYSKEVTFNSYLSGDITLTAYAGSDFENSVKKEVAIRVMQPTVSIAFHVVEGILPYDLRGLPVWVKAAKEAFGLGDENLLHIKVPGKDPKREVYYDVVRNNKEKEWAPPTLPGPLSYEAQLVEDESRIEYPDLFRVIGDDVKASYYARGHFSKEYLKAVVIPRQCEELLKLKRKNSYINVYIPNELFQADVSSSPKGITWGAISLSGIAHSFDPNNDMKVSFGSCKCFTKEIVGIVKPTIAKRVESGIVLRSLYRKDLTPAREKYLAHEIGHILLLVGDEHEWEINDPKINLMTNPPTDSYLNPKQFIAILYGKRTPDNNYIIEE